MDTPNDTWAEFWLIGLKPNEEKSLSLEIIKIYKEFWKHQSLSSKSKTTKRRYSNGLAAIDLKRRRLMVQQGKGGKDRVVYISNDAHDALIAYLKLRSNNRTKRVFLVEKGTYKGQAISVRGIQKRIEYYAKKTRINVSCHRLRHTMATQLLNAEAEVETIQDLLGHNWITTTQRYCKVSNLKVQRDYFKAMRNVLQRSAQPLSNQMFDPGG
jgi:hypothetical protein